MPLPRLLRNTLITALVIAAFVISYRVTEADFPRLFRDLPKGRELLTAFLTPDVFTRDLETRTVSIVFPVPCGSASVEEVFPAEGPRLVPSVNCAAPLEKFTLQGFDLQPNSEVVIRWRLPDERTMTAIRTQTDANGYFSQEVQARPIQASVNGVASRLEVDTLTPVGGLKPSQALKDVLDNMFVTIFMALLSTTLATLIAAPLSFLAASNITRKGCFGTGVYYLFRSFFNLMRSYDPLVMATVFGFWLSFGPFPGFLALTVVTIASLGKLFSEAVENIDPGPVEALQATGAPPLHTVRYAVVPQIVPDFVSYIIYHWDINVRISTIIGFVGGGGIGYYLNLSINDFKWNQAGTAIWAIVIVVWAMDFLSAEVRKRLT
ncbi:MAG: phosphonate ABC transporter, permease protein PhnE [Anaerolineae bacterium]|nr:MAG: phosphonate ABC transporter, permease protein PhnE [Anaerolineae bacterium]